MKTKLLLTIILINLFTICSAQKSPSWDKWTWLIGEWKGEGNGQTGQGEGTFSLKPDLEDRVLIRKSHSEYPATENKPKIIHDDLMVVYKDLSGNPSKAIYFDNEGHTISYTISYADKTIIMTSEKIPNYPVFRLTYISNQAEMIHVKFEMSQDGEKFITYTEGKCRKVN